MENNLKDDFRVGLTEDEFNNLLIDIWSSVNKPVENNGKNEYHYFDAITGEVKVSDKPISVTITLKGNI